MMLRKKLKVFVGGIIQGGLNTGHENQNYLSEIRTILEEIFPGEALIFSQSERYLHAAKQYNDYEIKLCYFSGLLMAQKANLCILYVPKASMGSSDEALMAYLNDVPVIVISPLSHNWALKTKAAKMLPAIKDLRSYLTSEEFQQVMQKDKKKRRLTLLQEAQDFFSWEYLQKENNITF